MAGKRPSPAVPRRAGSRQPRWLLRVRPVIRRIADVFPFTPLGLLLLAGSSVALFYFGLQRIDLVLLVVGIVGLALGALSLLATSITALVLWLRMRKAARGPEAEPLRLECGHPSATGFSVSSLWYVPFVRVTWTWAAPAARARRRNRRGRLHEEVLPDRRCLADTIERRMEVRDSFGITKIAFTAREKRTVQVLPSVGALRQMHVVRSLSAGEDISHPDGPPEGEPVDMRRYNPGDPIKFILWKVFAKSRTLVVRTPERAISPARQTIAYLVTSADDEAAAGAARVAIETGSLGRDWVLGADGDGRRASKRDEALDVLSRSASTAPEQCGAGLGKFLDTLSRASGGRAIVFVPPRPGPWLDRVIAAVKGRGGGSAVSPVEFVVCADGIVRDEKRGRLARLAYGDERRAPGSTTVAQEELQAVIRALAAARARVMVVDRRAGRVFNEAALEMRREREVAA